MLAIIELMVGNKILILVNPIASWIKEQANWMDKEGLQISVVQSGKELQKPHRLVRSTYDTKWLIHSREN
jgi:hypothetical protein